MSSLDFMFLLGGFKCTSFYLNNNWVCFYFCLNLGLPLLLYAFSFAFIFIYIHMHLT
ncbi:hypothetical protein M5D96_008919 [Drosophila gunungcola]|uniref:Uncharacterized protein n=1 Tax=Drosophila gunungcola TaxID=103775 RepID=A0A9P9YJN1_9MUSC|nr:hypothetical protein M5D96_008919 [Drosophila gunungcola]